MLYKNLKLHSKITRIIKALEAVLEKVKPPALDELKSIEDCKTTVNGIDFYVTKHSSTHFASEKIKENYDEKVLKIKKKFIKDGLATTSSRESIAAKIPTASKETMFAKASAIYRKYFSETKAKAA